MDTSVILSHLQIQFPGQLVLYVNDIAMALGKSDRAISHLIARKKSPFEIKKIGGLRCVSIFEFAEWLAGSAEAVQQVIEKPATVPSSAKGVRAATAGQKVAKPLLTALPVPEQAVPAMSSMAAKLLKMRQGLSDFMSRLAGPRQDKEWLLLLQEVSETLFFSGDRLDSSYVATIRKLAPTGHKVRGHETTRYYEAQEPAILYLMAKVHGHEAWRNKNSWQFILKHRDETLIHLVKNGDRWVQIENSVGVGFGGLW